MNSPKGRRRSIDRGNWSICLEWMTFQASWILASTVFLSFVFFMAFWKLCHKQLMKLIRSGAHFLIRPNFLYSVLDSYFFAEASYNFKPFFTEKIDFIGEIVAGAIERKCYAKELYNLINFRAFALFTTYHSIT